MESIVLATGMFPEHAGWMLRRIRIVRRRGQPFLLLPTHALVHLHAKPGDSIAVRIESTGVCLDRIARSPSIHRKIERRIPKYVNRQR